MELGSKRLITMGTRDNKKYSFDVETLNCNEPSRFCRKKLFGLSQAAMGVLATWCSSVQQLRLAGVADGLQQRAIVEPIDLGQRRFPGRTCASSCSYRLHLLRVGASSKPGTVHSCDIACTEQQGGPPTVRSPPQAGGGFLFLFCQTL